ncbi:MAG: hypothetical protein U0457_05165 [Candidatus Sericytochromatia bacterium]
MEKITTECNRIVYFGIQTQKGNTYFGDEVNKLTPFVIQKSTEVVSVDGKIIAIHSVEKSKEEKTFHLEDGRTLVVKAIIDSNGNTKRTGVFSRKWK